MLLANEKEMKRPAQRVIREIARRKNRRSATVLALVGDLGSGKTTFTRAFAEALGIRGSVTSPTFVLARRYRIPKKKSPTYNLQPIARRLWHLDAYRLRDVDDLTAIDFHAMISEPENIVVIEWADKILPSIPKKALWIRFDHHPRGRIVRFKK